MGEPTCPQCGEDDDLRGELVGDDIEVVCLSCGSRFERGTPRCRRCGRTNPVRGTQRMTRFARGTLLAVVGMREVLLCRSCDDEVANHVLHRAQLVPDDYESRFVSGEVREAPAPRPATRRQPRSPSAPVPRASSPAAPSGINAGAGEAKAAVSPTDPTVRQATEAFLEQASEPVDHLCLVLIGTELGASTRLSRLDAQTAETIGAWMASKLGTATQERREQARTTITALVDHWLAQGWVSTDLASALR